MQLGALHLQGKPVGSVPLANLPGSPTRPLVAGEEFYAARGTLEDAIKATQAWTMGSSRPGALIIGGGGRFEAYALSAAAALGRPAGPFHFEGTSLVPRHTLSEGVAFVDGATVIRR